MALLTYEMKSIYLHQLGAVFAELQERTRSMQHMLSAVGDYWTQYYKDMLTLRQAASGSVAVISNEYAKMLDFVLSADILDIPDETRSQFDMLYFDMLDFVPMVRDGHGGYTPLGKHIYDTSPEEMDAMYVPFPGVRGIPYISTSLFEASVVLVEGVHYHIVEDDGIYFFVDIFNDSSIVPYTYTADDEEPSQEDVFITDDTVAVGRFESTSRDKLTHKFLILWACGTVLSSTVIYERYGRFLYRKHADSEVYHWLITALMRYYSSAKTRDAIEQAVNILCGAPYTRTEGERIISIDYVDNSGIVLPSRENADQLRVFTTANTYYIPADIDADAADFVAVGVTYPQYSMIYRVCTVDDYISNPDWWCEKDPVSGEYIIPDTILRSVLTHSDSNTTADPTTREQKNDIIDKLLKYNTYYVRINMADSAFVSNPSLRDDILELIQRGTPIYLYPFIRNVITLFLGDYVPHPAAHDQSMYLGLSVTLEDTFVWSVPDAEVTEDLYHSGYVRRNSTVGRSTTNTYLSYGEEQLLVGYAATSDEDVAAIETTDTLVDTALALTLEDDAIETSEEGVFYLYRWFTYDSSMRIMRDGTSYLHGSKRLVYAL